MAEVNSEKGSVVDIPVLSRHGSRRFRLAVASLRYAQGTIISFLMWSLTPYSFLNMEERLKYACLA